MLHFHVKLKKYDIFITITILFSNADVWPKCPEIGWTVGSLLKRPTYASFSLLPTVGRQPLSYIIPWRSGSYTCFSNRSVAKNMADFGLCWRQIHAIWYLRLQVITTDQAQFWSRLNFYTLLVFCRILFCFLSFRGIKFCRFFSVFSMFSGRLTICLSICKF